MRHRYRTWTVFAVALCCLLALMLVPSIAALRRSEQVYREVRTIQQNHERSQRLLESLAEACFSSASRFASFCWIRPRSPTAYTSSG